MKKNSNKILKKAFTMLELTMTMIMAGVISFALYKSYSNKLINEEAYNYSRDIVKFFDAYVVNKNYGYIKFNGNKANFTPCTTSFYYEVDNNLTMGKVKLCADLDTKIYKTEFHHIEDDKSFPLCDNTQDETNICYDDGKDRKGRTYLRTEYLKNCRAFLGSRNDENDTQGAINNRVELFLDCSRVENKKQKAIIEFYTYNLFTQTKDRISSHRLPSFSVNTMTYSKWIGEDNATGDGSDGQVLIIFDLGRG
jgi:type II secretory pathway pseudopilin PulG